MELICPRCRRPLRVRQIEGALAAGCGRCGGVWLGTSADQTLRVALDPSSHQAAQDSAASAQRAAVDEAEVARCPDCGDLMRRLCVGPVEVDHCPAHGTWYDLGELERVAEQLQAQARGAAVEVNDKGVPGPKAVVPGVAMAAAAAGPAWATAHDDGADLDLDLRGRGIQVEDATDHGAPSGGRIAKAWVPPEEAGGPPPEEQGGLPPEDGVDFGGGARGYGQGGMDGEGLSRARSIAEICKANGADRGLTPDQEGRDRRFRDRRGSGVFGLLGELLDFD